MQGEEEKVTIDTVSTEKPADNSSHKLAWFLIILVLGLSAILLYVQYLKPSLSNNNEIKEEAKEFDPWFKSNFLNIKFLKPEGWQEINSDNTAFPEGYNKPIVILKNNQTECVMALTTGLNKNPKYKQVSYDKLVFSKFRRFNSEWFIPTNSTSPKSDYYGETRQYLENEFRQATDGDDNTYLLYMNDGSPVVDDCNSDFTNLLKSAEPHYETTKIDSTSQGVITTNKVWDDVTQEKDGNKTYEHLIFTPDNSKEAREIMRIPRNSWTERFFIHDNKLYTISNVYKYFDDVKYSSAFDSAIYVIDPFSQKTEQVQGSFNENTYISSLYVHNGIAYYLAIDSINSKCIDGYNNCASDMYSIPISGGTPVLVAKTSVGGTIVGYVENEKAFYIMRSTGDAGCMFQTISKIVNGTEEILGKYNYCEGDEPLNAREQKFYENILSGISRASSVKPYGRGLRIQDNVLKPIPLTKDNRNDAFFHLDI